MRDGPTKRQRETEDGLMSSLTNLCIRFNLILYHTYIYLCNIESIIFDLILTEIVENIILESKSNLNYIRIVENEIMEIHTGFKKS